MKRTYFCSCARQAQITFALTCSVSPVTPAAFKEMDPFVFLLGRGVSNDVPLWKQVRTAAAHAQGPNWCQTTPFINKGKKKHIVVLICI